MLSPSAPPATSDASSLKRTRPDDNKDLTEEPATKRFNTNYSAVITVLAGLEEQSFVVHKRIIGRKSQFFKKASSHNWKEGQEKLVKLPDIEPEVFEAYVSWIYSGKTIVELGTFSANQECRDKCARPCEILRCQLTARALFYFKLYAAATFLQDDALRIKIVDRLQDLAARRKIGPEFALVEYVWTETVSGCGLQRLVVDYFAVNSTAARRDKYRHCGRNFMWALATRLLDSRGLPMEDIDLENMPSCHYHDHQDGETCAEPI